MKKLIFAFITAFAVSLSVMCAEATTEYVNEPVLNANDNTYTIGGVTPSGLSGRMVTIVLMNPEFTIDDAVQTPSSVQANLTTKTDESGGFCFNIRINPSTITTDGYLKAYVGGDDFEQYEVISKYYASESVRIAAVEDLKTEITGDKLSEYAEKLSYDSKRFDAVSGASIATMIKNDNVTLTTENVSSVIEEYAIVEAFNEGKTELLLSAPTVLLQGDAVALEKADTNGANAYELYNTIISEVGREKIISGLFSKNLKNMNDVRKQFVKNTLAFGVSNSKLSGYGHVGQLLTKANADAAGVSFSQYLSLSASQKAKASIDIMNGTYSDESQLESAASSAAKAAAKDKEPSGGGGGGGASGGSSSDSFMSVQTYDNIKNNESAAEENVVFFDIADYSWARESIEKLYEKNIISGTGDKSFSPSDNITREQLAKIICAAYGISGSENTGVFTDVQSGAWYEVWVNAAYESGAVKGIGDGLFGVGQFVTRQDFALMIYRISNSLSESGKTDFTDSQLISPYAHDAVAALSGAKVINGFEDGSFRPLDYCTRAEAAVIIDRALKVVE